MKLQIQVRFSSKKNSSGFKTDKEIAFCRRTFVRFVRSEVEMVIWVYFLKENVKFATVVEQ